MTNEYLFSKGRQSETVIRMVGDRSQNISAILKNMCLDQATEEMLEKVMHIFYDKIDKLRKERNFFKAQNKKLGTTNQQLHHKIEKLTDYLQTIQLRSQKISQSHLSIQSQQKDRNVQKISKVDELEPVYIFSKVQQTLRSNAASEDKENISTSNTNPLNLGQLLSKYNLTPSQLHPVLVGHINEERKLLDKLETESQKELYLASKKSKNYNSWLRKVKKDCQHESEKKGLRSVGSAIIGSFGCSNF